MTARRKTPRSTATNHRPGAPDLLGHLPWQRQHAADGDPECRQPGRQPVRRDLYRTHTFLRCGGVEMETRAGHPSSLQNSRSQPVSASRRSRIVERRIVCRRRPSRDKKKAGSPIGRTRFQTSEDARRDYRRRRMKPITPIAPAARRLMLVGSGTPSNVTR